MKNDPKTIVIIKKKQSGIFMVHSVLLLLVNPSTNPARHRVTTFDVCNAVTTKPNSQPDYSHNAVRTCGAEIK